MGKIWANELLPKALKTYPKFNKLPNLVTLLSTQISYIEICHQIHHPSHYNVTPVHTFVSDVCCGWSGVPCNL